MATNPAIDPSRRRSIQRFGFCYAQLLKLYPTEFREVFADSMRQTFNDLLHERLRADPDSRKGLLGYAIWLYAEALCQATAQHMRILKMRLLRIALVTGALLLVPLVANLVSNEFRWSVGDFAIAGAIIFAAGVAFDFVARKGDLAYRFGVGLALVGAVLLVWMNLAVGLIGNESNPANLMYLGVLGVGVVGAVIARFRAAGMARALFATAAAQAVVAAIALAAGLAAPVLETLLINGFFAALFVGSALLFTQTDRASASSG